MCTKASQRNARNARRRPFRTCSSPGRRSSFKSQKNPAPVLLHYDLDIVQRVLRDQVTEDFKAIWVDNEEMYENVLNFMQRFQPTLVNRVKLYTRSGPIFDAFNITQELEKALRPK